MSTVKVIVRKTKGGGGSGNWGHAGIPGQVGGSAPGSGKGGSVPSGGGSGSTPGKGSNAPAAEYDPPKEISGISYRGFRASDYLTGNMKSNPSHTLAAVASGRPMKVGTAAEYEFNVGSSIEAIRSVMVKNLRWKQLEDGRLQQGKRFATFRQLPEDLRGRKPFVLKIVYPNTRIATEKA
jgi:hypothetical protein